MTVPRFIDCATREYGVELPIKLVAGAVGVKGRRIAYHGGPANGIGTEYPCPKAAREFGMCRQHAEVTAKKLAKIGL